MQRSASSLLTTGFQSYLHISFILINLEYQVSYPSKCPAQRQLNMQPKIACLQIPYSVKQQSNSKCHWWLDRTSRLNTKISLLLKKLCYGPGYLFLMGPFQQIGCFWSKGILLLMFLRGYRNTWAAWTENIQFPASQQSVGYCRKPPLLLSQKK